MLALNLLNDFLESLSSPRQTPHHFNYVNLKFQECENQET